MTGVTCEEGFTNGAFGISAVVKSQEKVNLWHARIWHSSYENMSKLTEILGLQTSSFVSRSCDICHRAKQALISYPISFNKASDPFDLVQVIYGKDIVHL